MKGEERDANGQGNGGNGKNRQSRELEQRIEGGDHEGHIFEEAEEADVYRHCKRDHGFAPRRGASAFQPAAQAVVDQRRGKQQGEVGGFAPRVKKEAHPQEPVVAPLQPGEEKITRQD